MTLSRELVEVGEYSLTRSWELSVMTISCCWGRSRCSFLSARLLLPGEVSESKSVEEW